MTQFMLVTNGAQEHLVGGVVLRRVTPGEELLCDVALEYFGDATQCWLVVDESGRTEPLLDQLWTAQQEGAGVTESRFGEFMIRLAEACVGYVCWCGPDFRRIARVRTAKEVREQLTQQTAQQPADVWLWFAP